MTPRPPGILPELGGILGTAMMGLWAFLGGVARSGADWFDPVTKRFSARLLFVALATAAVLGQIAVWWGVSHDWEPSAIGVTASMLGYLGPAVVMSALRNWAKIQAGSADVPKD